MAWSFSGDRPIYAQLVEQMQKRIVTGEYPPGSRLKSVRELAGEAAVNPNTMQRAMAELELQGLVFTQRTAGRFVTEDTAAIEAVRERMAQERLERFRTELTELGFSIAEIIALMRREETEHGKRE